MRLITRSDFDGLSCGVLLTHLGLIDSWYFVHPKDVQDGKVTAGPDDVVANIPYIPGCGLWFDHHSSEAERLEQLKTVVFKGSSQSAPSCARVIYDYYGAAKLAGLEELVRFTDKVDSGDLTSEEILHPEGWILLGFICDPRTGLGRFRDFTISNLELMKKLSFELQTKSIDQILALPDVKERIDVYFAQTERFIAMIRAHSRIENNILMIDLRGVDEIPAGNRFLLYTLYPDQNISVQIQDGKAKQNAVINVGYSIINKTATADIGSILLKFGGGGHQYVGTCQVPYQDIDNVLSQLIPMLRQ